MNVVSLIAMTLIPIAVLVSGQPAHAFGLDGHRVAGQIAETYLCTQARIDVDRLADGESLAELGLWADRVRNVPPWDNSGPWHYLNIADDSPLAGYDATPEGDVLWAIAHFRSRLGDGSLRKEFRSEALKFLVHFIVDLHQPLHVGRRDDRGGTGVRVLLGDERLTLHRFWDTEAIPSAGLNASQYAKELMPLAELLIASQEPSEPRQWAQESLSLRRVVYNFDQRSARLDADYQRIAADVVQLRLIQAGLRLAAEVNGVFCSTETSLRP
jgi:hypothetical protein